MPDPVYTHTHTHTHKATRIQIHLDQHPWFLFCFSHSCCCVSEGDDVTDSVDFCLLFSCCSLCLRVLPPPSSLSRPGQLCLTVPPYVGKTYCNIISTLSMVTHCKEFGLFSVQRHLNAGRHLSRGKKRCCAGRCVITRVHAYA